MMRTDAHDIRLNMNGAPIACDPKALHFGSAAQIRRGYGWMTAFQQHWGLNLSLLGLDCLKDRGYVTYCMITDAIRVWGLRQKASHDSRRRGSRSGFKEAHNERMVQLYVALSRVSDKFIRKEACCAHHARAGLPARASAAAVAPRCGSPLSSS